MAKKGYKMPDPLPKGELLKDLSKKEWRLGPSIGKGGFGEIYSAQECSSSGSKYPYVVKIEPHENGPLFVEMHFYMKNCKAADLEAFKSKQKLSTFGMPAFLGSGSHMFKGDKYRFLVMDKFGTDIDKLIKSNGGSLPVATVFQLAWQIIHALEYIHGFGYVHADIKGANILLGLNSSTKNQAYLVDFGLATKITSHPKFQPNPKKAHDGTIEYLSRDAHHGVPTRRGDLEILAYNIVHWLGGKLPWEQKLKDPKQVHALKEDAMKNIPKFLKSAFGNKNIPGSVPKFLDYIETLKFNDVPNYQRIRDMFKSEVEKAGSKIDSPLKFESKPSLKRRSVSRTRSPAKKAKSTTTTTVSNDGDVQISIEKTKNVTRRKYQTTKNTRPKNNDESDESDSEEVVVTKKTTTKKTTQRHKKLESDEEETEEKTDVKKKKIVRKPRTIKESPDKDAKLGGVQGEVLTEAMKEVLARRALKANAPKTKRARVKKVVSSDDDVEMEELKENLKKCKSDLFMNGIDSLVTKMNHEVNGSPNGGRRNKRNVERVNYLQS